MLQAASPLRAFFPDRGDALGLLRWPKALLLTCTLLSVFSSIVRADIVPDATTRAELRQWSDLYWHRVQTGQAAANSSTLFLH